MQPSPASTATAVPSGVVVVERPPAGLARGRYASPPSAIVMLGVLAVAFAVAYTFWRWRKHRG